MPLVVPKVGEVFDLEFRRLNLFPGKPLGLFQNNLIPTINTVFGDLVEANFSGYARVNTSWPNAAFLNVGNAAQVVGNPCLFVQDGSGVTFNTCYGYFIVSGTTLLWVERFSAPAPILVAGSGVGVIPVMTYLTQFSG